MTGQKGANIYLLERKEDCSDYRKEIRMITTVTETARKLEETGRIFSHDWKRRNPCGTFIACFIAFLTMDSDTLGHSQ